MIKMNKEKDLEFEINPARLKYILELYNVSEKELIFLLNDGRKKELLNVEKLNKILEKKEKVSLNIF